ncbi:MAG: aconitase/3-isopropylmalate dehydratase large subunit family protein [Candidatus Thorarchaeota archaeon]|jgi:3-isopropylmalate/(R)-2-methylmalate dehydratase large subunit
MVLKKTIVEKILSKKSGRDVCAGEIVETEVDVLMGHDPLIAMIINDFENLSGKIWDKDKLIFIADHFAPPASVERAGVLKKFLDFTKKHDIKNFYMFSGICHQILAEHPDIAPGKIVIGTDSHTVMLGTLNCLATGMGSTDALYIMLKGQTWMRVPETYRIDIIGNKPKWILGKDIILEVLRRLGESGAIYKSLEFHDETDNKISMASRFSISNMSVEAGAKVGIFSFDKITEDFLKQKNSNFERVDADENVNYEKTFTIDISNLEPLVAKPFSPANVVPVNDVKGIELDQVFIGSCTGGRLEDFRIAAKILEGKKVKKFLKVIAIPSSVKIYLECLKRGYIQTLLEAGVAISNPSCGPCGNIDKGIISSGERVVSTSNRNFRGRMGALDGDIFLTSTATAAASALEGKITDPRDYL